MGLPAIVPEAMRGSDPFQQEELVRRYSQWYEEPPGSLLAGLEKKALSFLLSSLPLSTILEVGCGSGYFSDWLHRLGHTVVGLDRSLIMLREAGRRFPNLPLLQGEAAHLPLSDHSFDLVAFITSLEFLEHPEAALREAARVARRGILLGTLNRWSPYVLSRLLRRCSPYLGACFYSRWQLEGLLRSVLDRPYRLVWTSALLSPRWGRAPTRFPGCGFRALRLDFLDGAGARLLPTDLSPAEDEVRGRSMVKLRRTKDRGSVASGEVQGY